MAPRFAGTRAFDRSAADVVMIEDFTSRHDTSYWRLPRLIPMNLSSASVKSHV
jgi:hypothetical protein